MPVLKELLTDLGFVQVSKAGWEADDILGTLAAACEAAGGTTLLIITKDFFAKRITLLTYQKSSL